MPLHHIATDDDVEVVEPDQQEHVLRPMRSAAAKPKPDLPVLSADHPATKSLAAARVGLDHAVESGNEALIEAAQKTLDKALVREHNARCWLKREIETRTRQRLERAAEQREKNRQAALAAEQTARAAAPWVSVRYDCGLVFEVAPSLPMDQVRRQSAAQDLRAAIFIQVRETDCAVGAAKLLAVGQQPKLMPRTIDQLEAEIRDIARRSFSVGCARLTRPS